MSDTNYTRLKRVLGKVLEEKREKDIILYPMGERGTLIKGILNGQMGVEEKYIIDNQLCKDCEWIHPVSLLGRIPCENYYIILTCENPQYVDKIIESLAPYSADYCNIFQMLENDEEENIPENYSKNVYSNISVVEGKIRDILSRGEPFSCGRIGATECVIAQEYCRMRLGTQETFSENAVRWLCNTSGFFTEQGREEEDIGRYAKMTVDAMRNMDMHLIWRRSGESFLLRNYAKAEAKFVEKNIVHFPWRSQGSTWMNGLEGKKVLVVSPFSDSVRVQYGNRKDLFANENNLPEFELITYQSLQTQMGASRGFKNWFEAYRYMEEEILGIEFEVALLGCGAYGYPLTAAISRAGKQAVEMCSSIQLMFGIKGKRWEERDYITKWWNDAWIYPLETPPEYYKEIEGGAYWG